MFSNRNDSYIECISCVPKETRVEEGRGKDEERETHWKHYCKEDYTIER